MEVKKMKNLSTFIVNIGTLICTAAMADTASIESVELSRNNNSFSQQSASILEGDWSLYGIECSSGAELVDAGKKFKAQPEFRLQMSFHNTVLSIRSQDLVKGCEVSVETTYEVIGKNVEIGNSDVTIEKCPGEAEKTLGSKREGNYRAAFELRKTSSVIELALEALGGPCEDGTLATGIFRRGLTR